MGKKLAIRGHVSRGKEVIEILEMLGGINDEGHNGTNTWKDEYYFLDNGYIRAYDWCDGIKFTLEEFLEKYPFKVGDKVIDDYVFGDPLTIKSMSWSEELKTVLYAFEEFDAVLAAKDLKPIDAEFLVDREKSERTHEDVIFDSIIWHLRNSVNNGKQNLSGGECEDYFREVVKKNNENKMKNVLAELLEHIKNTSKEELEKEFNELEEWSNVSPTVEEFMTFCECVNKPKYPTTYEECCEIIHSDPNFYIDTHLYSGTLEILYKLLICRDTYWKIAGEQMGLDKPWEPQFENCSIPHYCIFINHRGEVLNDCFYGSRCLLAFPTKEMRDVFYENFKDLIEQCKELL